MVSLHRSLAAELPILSLLFLASACTTPETTVPRSAPGPIEASYDRAPVFAQGPVGAMACGPAGFYNSLMAGSEGHRLAAESLAGEGDVERVRSIIDIWGQGPSISYPAPRRLYDKKGGTTCEDMTAIVNAFLDDHDLPPARSEWLDRRPNETQDDQLRRVHAVLTRGGLPPMIELRSFAAQEREPDRMLWHGLFGHWLSVRSVSPLPDGPASGFLMTCADSVTGREIPVFVYRESVRPFTATRGYEVDEKGKEKWTWVKNAPYLLVTVPDLSLSTANTKWFERSFIAMTQVIVEVPADDATSAEW